VSRFPTVLDSNNQAVDLSQVTISNKPTGGRSPSAGNAQEVASEPSLMNQLLLQVSVVFILVSGYYAMVLTNWATEQANASISNPRSGRAAMWIQAAGQWIAIAMYGWSLIAPRILSDRDF
jgi:cell wall-associated NlpC family hydrolase